MARSAAKDKDVTVTEALIEATNIKRRSSDTPEKFKDRLLQAADDLDNDTFEAMPTAAQKWVNTALRAYNGEDGHKKGTLIILPGFDDDDKEKEPEEKEERVSRRSRDAEDDEEKKPSRRAAKDDEEEDVKRPARRAAKEEEEEEEEKKPARGRGRPPKAKVADDEEEEKKPAKAKGKAKEEEEEEPAKKRGRPAKVESKGNGKAPSKAESKGSAARGPRIINKDGAVYKIKEVLLRKPASSADDILEVLTDKMGKEAPTISTIRGIRSDFLHSLTVLADRGKLTDVAGYAD